jgi:hypothetical protein
MVAAPREGIDENELRARERELLVMLAALQDLFFKS